MEKIYLANANQKKIGVAIIISDEDDFRARKILGLCRALYNDVYMSLKLWKFSFFSIIPLYLSKTFSNNSFTFNIIPCS